MSDLTERMIAEVVQLRERVAHLEALETPVAGEQLLVNGGFEVWQRGNGPFTVESAFTADRWQINLIGTDTISVSKNTTNQDAASAACAACTFTRGTGTDSALFQSIEDFAQLRGRTITLSVRVKTSTANAVRLSVQDNVTTGYSAFHTGSGSYETLTATVTVGAAATAVRAIVLLDASCTAYLDNAMLVLGSVAATHAPLTPAEEWERCQRYYYTTTIDFIVEADSSGSAEICFLLPHKWPTKMAVNPTLTVGQVTSSNPAGCTIGADTPDVDGCHLYVNQAAGLASNSRIIVTGGTLTAEANP